jgi:AcrR family transcriptional regulator
VGEQGRADRGGSATRRQILEASLRLFSQRGFTRTTVRDIARHVGITDAAIYYHFSSKRELLEALVEEKGFISHLQNLEQLAPTASLRECLAIMARRAVEIMDSHRDFLRLIVLEGLAGDEAMGDQYRRLVDRWERALSVVLGRFQERGELGDADPARLSRQIISLILGAFLDSLMRRPSQEDAEERRRALASLVVEAIGALLAGLR